MKQQLWLLFLAPALCGVQPAFAQSSTNSEFSQTNTAALQSEIDRAMDQVRKIVNQPVAELARRPGIHVARLDGWFHPGAITPDFDHADVTQTQEFPYDKLGYVTSDLNPGVVFVGTQLEFNSQLKYFYADRSLPKKKLTRAEMQEINRLYRVIGNCQDQIAAIQENVFANAQAKAEAKAGIITKLSRVSQTTMIIYGGATLAIILMLYGIYKLAR